MKFLLSVLLAVIGSEILAETASEIHILFHLPFNFYPIGTMAAVYSGGLSAGLIHSFIRSGSMTEFNWNNPNLYIHWINITVISLAIWLIYKKFNLTIKKPFQIIFFGLILGTLSFIASSIPQYIIYKSIPNSASLTNPWLEKSIFLLTRGSIIYQSLLDELVSKTVSLFIACIIIRIFFKPQVTLKRQFIFVLVNIIITGMSLAGIVVWKRQTGIDIFSDFPSPPASRKYQFSDKRQLVAWDSTQPLIKTVYTASIKTDKEDLLLAKKTLINNGQPSDIYQDIKRDIYNRIHELDGNLYLINGSNFVRINILNRQAAYFPSSEFQTQTNFELIKIGDSGDVLIKTASSAANYYLLKKNSDRLINLHITCGETEKCLFVNPVSENQLGSLVFTAEYNDHIQLFFFGNDDVQKHILLEYSKKCKSQTEFLGFYNNEILLADTITNNNQANCLKRYSNILKRSFDSDKLTTLINFKEFIGKDYVTSINYDKTYNRLLISTSDNFRYSFDLDNNKLDVSSEMTQLNSNPVTDDTVNSNINLSLIDNLLDIKTYGTNEPIKISKLVYDNNNNISLIDSDGDQIELKLSEILPIKEIVSIGNVKKVSEEKIAFEAKTKAGTDWKRKVYFLTHQGIYNKNIISDDNKKIGIYDLNRGEIYLLDTPHSQATLVASDPGSKSILVSYPIYYYLGTDTDSKEGLIYTIYNMDTDRIRNNFIVDYWGGHYDLYSSDISGPNLYSQLVPLSKKIKTTEMDNRLPPQIDMNSQITVEPDSLECIDNNCSFLIRVGGVTRSEFGSYKDFIFKGIINDRNSLSLSFLKQEKEKTNQ